MAACSQNNEPQHIGQAISEYSNPIDEYFPPKIESAFPEIARRELQDAYRGVWEIEFQNVVAWLESKCYYQEDIDKLMKYTVSVDELISTARELMLNEWLAVYEILPNDPDRNSWGNGTRSGLNQVTGEIYRNAAILLIEHCDGYEFRKIDYSKEHYE